MKEIKLKVSCDQPMTLQKFLMEKQGVSRRLLTRLKRLDGGITRNGITIRSIDLVENGDEIILRPDTGSPLEAAPTLKVPVAFENDAVVVFSKPGGMPVHPSIRHQGDTLGNCFAAMYPELAFRAVNRLDRDTSGLCVVAKDAYSARILQNSCKKVYYAAAQGVTPEQGTIDAPIARQCESIILRCVREDGQRAVTHYRRIQTDGNHSLLRIELETGRTHQIRVHFSHIGHPLAGDDLYGGSRKYISRQGLHCGEMTFTDPVTGKELTVHSPIPEDMKNLFKENNTMEKIASFQVDHTKFGVGMYISRIDDDIITYDVRMVKPNGGVYISSPSLHTIEHLFATYARNSAFGKNIVYVGPMGCRTGFYLLTRGMSHEDAISLVKSAYRFIADYNEEIPGCTEIECGNYLEHDLDSAQRDVLPLLEALENYTPEMLDYSWHFTNESK